MFTINNARRLVSAVFAKVFRAFLLAVFSILIAALGLLAFGMLITSLQRLSLSNFWQPLLGIVMGIMVILVIPILVLRFFEDRPRVKQVTQWLRRLLRWLSGLVMIVAAPYGILAFTVVAVGIAWFFILYFTGLLSLSTSASQYAIATCSAIIFTVFGQKATQWAIRWVGKGDIEVPWLYYLLRPSMVRVYVYALLAVAYFIANLENFSGLVVLAWPWWQGVKEWIVEMLLTYAAFDAIFTAWRDHQEGSKGQSFWRLFFPKS